LPIGGIREKATAAHRAGLQHILAPALNKKDLEDIPETVLKDLKITFVKDVIEVLQLSLGIGKKSIHKAHKRTRSSVATEEN
jgi:ATP-dependent Lon protease